MSLIFIPFSYLYYPPLLVLCFSYVLGFHSFLLPVCRILPLVLFLPAPLLFIPFYYPYLWYSVRVFDFFPARNVLFGNVVFIFRMLLTLVWALFYFVIFCKLNCGSSHFLICLVFFRAFYRLDGCSARLSYQVIVSNMGSSICQAVPFLICPFCFDACCRLVCCYAQI